MLDHEISDEQAPLNICEMLRQDILTLKIKPGTRLHERAIAGKMEVSRTPIREALFVLETEGLVRRYPKLGFVVAELTLRDVLESFQIREFIEPPAAAIAAKVLRKDDLEELRKMLETLATEDIEESRRNVRHDLIDVRIHDLIIKAVGNERLVDIMENIRGVCARARCLGTPIRFHESTNEHLELIGELINGNSENAERCMKKHLEETRKRLTSYI